MLAQREERNLLLGALPAEDYAWLRESLEPVPIKARRPLIEPHQPLGHVHFIRRGVASIVATEAHGGLVEVGTVGNEGFVGLSVLYGTERTTYQVIAQVEGDAWRLPVDDFRRALDERPAVRALALRYAHYYTDQVSQLVACNRLHGVEQRCARWLLLTHDRLGEDQFALTHEFIAQMLGVRRAGVTVTMGALQERGALRLARGRLTILDRDLLEDAACECYRVTREAQARLYPSA